MFAEVFSFLYQFADVFAFLILSAAGLAIVFGMMGVINMAHGEFIMCGAYVTVGLVHGGFPLPLAQLCGMLAAGLIGVAVEWSIVRKLYKRPTDSLLATWGLSLIVTQGMLLVFGSSLAGVGTPAGSFTVGDYTFSVYRMVLFAVAVAVLAAIYFIFMRTRFGVHARATMQNAAIAQATGVRVGNVYALSFGIGAALAGLCGAMYAPTMTLIPTMGASFLVESFVTVVVGGANVLLGTAPAGILLAGVRTALNGWGGQIIGQIGMLLA
ncbi:MAG: branched-chain amino acid ABC transporter permease, partial [Gammaproteobacteria bacterium]|nr:branched-chain amino acid ABC transporter permease [Gammaproteobacteria bacterium]